MHIILFYIVFIVFYTFNICINLIYYIFTADNILIAEQTLWTHSKYGVNNNRKFGLSTFVIVTEKGENAPHPHPWTTFWSLPLFSHVWRNIKFYTTFISMKKNLKNWLMSSLISLLLLKKNLHSLKKLNQWILNWIIKSRNFIGFLFSLHWRNFTIFWCLHSFL